MHTEARAGEIIEHCINKDNPWPGLSAFTEEGAFYFHGRDKEAMELYRLIKREPLTVLFGLSGLGKTSLLRAGVFPKLRRENFLPVYVRINYAPDAIDLVSQLKQAVLDAAARAEIEAPPTRPGETLWDFFHRTTNEFKNSNGRVVTPVIVFDQFEEMFTLGANSDEGQARITAFLKELGDLIENRAPENLDEAAAETFSFYKRDFKVVFTLREDFLANLESLANQLPSIVNNRFRLQKMNGAQAFEVITLSGGALVTDEVAERMVKMVAGRDPYKKVPLESMDIEPTLLSVFCRELNTKRLDHGDDTITPQLISGAKEEILTSFYERALTGYDDRMRHFIEDQLLTGSGYRNSVDLQDALKIPGVSHDAILTLINRRLLRVEDSARMPRLELTHDVLTEVIKKSRDERVVREANARAEEQARRNAEEMRQKDRELHESQRQRRLFRALFVTALLCLIISVIMSCRAWQEEASAELAKLQANSATRKIRESNDRADRFINSTLRQLHQRLVALGRVSLLNDPAHDAVPLLAQQTVDEGGTMSDDQLIFQEGVHSTLGDVFRANGDIAGALPQYEASIENAQQLFDRHKADQDPEKLKYEEQLSEKLSGPANTLIDGSLADVQIYEAHYDKAKILYGQSDDRLQDVKHVATTPADKLWVQRQTGNLLGRRGDIFRSTGDYTNARNFYQQSLDLRKTLADANPDSDDCQYDLISAYSRLSSLDTLTGHLQTAFDSGDSARKLREQYAQKRADDINWQRQLFYGYLMLGRLLVMEGKLADDSKNPGALTLLQKGLDREKALYLSDRANQDLQRELGFGYIFFGNYYRAAGHWDTAQTTYQAGFDQMPAHVDTNNLLLYNFVGVSHLVLGDSLAHARQYADAATHYQQAQTAFEKVVHANPHNSDWQHNLALLYERQGYLAEAQSKKGEAHSDFVLAKQVFDNTLAYNGQDPINNNASAWLLATCPEPDLRDPSLAVQRATQACTISSNGYWEFVDTLAATQAANHDLPAAIASEKSARQIIDKSDTNEIEGLGQRLNAYQSGTAAPPAYLNSVDR